LAPCLTLTLSGVPSAELSKELHVTARRAGSAVGHQHPTDVKLTVVPAFTPALCDSEIESLD